MFTFTDISKLCSMNLLNEEETIVETEKTLRIIKTLKGSEETMTLLQEIITAIRTLRNENNIHPAEFIYAYTTAHQDNSLLIDGAEYLKNMAKIDKIVTLQPNDDFDMPCKTIPNGMIFYINYNENNIEKELKKLNAEFSKVRIKLSNLEFLNKAPKEIVNEMRDRGNRIVLQINNLRSGVK